MKRKRFFDVFFALTAITALFPLLLLLGMAVRLNSQGPAFYVQERVGRMGRRFRLFKFRTMYSHQPEGKLLTVGMRDSRITPLGYYLRKYKIDEFPQLFNILRGEMSFVGPRPEVSKYVAFYSHEQMRVLTVRPGITDWASICFFDENRLLDSADDPEQYYVNHIMPVKLSFNLRYVAHHNLKTDLKILLLTFKRIFSIPDPELAGIDIALPAKQA
ncbi:sugar transferase [Pedobacter sp. SYP-B3415]|uniref:sugar transferase n=1 Tax=Pedobacter sp. SYP-B3415 TaxID=2496641 RepID=UPI00101BEC21|nr:sugar transferase [Pedobacter sp. SYP-B3415]